MIAGERDNLSLGIVVDIFGVLNKLFELISVLSEFLLEAFISNEGNILRGYLLFRVALAC